MHVTFLCIDLTRIYYLIKSSCMLTNDPNVYSDLILFECKAMCNTSY